MKVPAEDWEKNSNGYTPPDHCLSDSGVDGHPIKLAAGSFHSPNFFEHQAKKDLDTRRAPKKVSSS